MIDPDEDLLDDIKRIIDNGLYFIEEFEDVNVDDIFKTMESKENEHQHEYKLL